MPMPDASLAEFVIKQHDVLPVIETILKDQNGAAIPLASAPVKFKMRSLGGGSVKVDAVATIVNPPGTDGRVRYVWQPGDTDTLGWYEAEWEVTFPGSQVTTLPNDGFDLIAIMPDVS